MKKKKLFIKGVRSLQSISDLDQDLYVCPICLKGFEEKAIETKVLTLEHVPQNSIGGKEILLTCKKCNNVAGHTIDAELHKRSKLHSIPESIVGLSEFEGRIILQIDGLEINTNATIENGKVRLNIPEDINHPRKRDQLFNNLEKLTKGGWDGKNFKIKSNIKYHKHKAKIAYIKSAYLAAFAALGYRYILREVLNELREQILNPEKKLISNIVLLESPDQPKKREIVLLEEPVTAVLVKIDHVLVFLPPIEKVEKPIDKISKYVSSNFENQTLSGKKVDWPNGMNLLLDSFSSSK